MYSNDFEEAFSCFLERRDYDEAANQLFTLARLAFAAGWQAAGGTPPQEEPIFTLLRGGAVAGQPDAASPPQTGLEAASFTPGSPGSFHLIS